MDLVFGLHDDKRSPAASEERPHDAKDSLRWAVELGLESFDSLPTPVLLGISQDLSAGVAVWENLLIFPAELDIKVLCSTKG